MRKSMWLTITLASLGLYAGCQKPDHTAVTVRFTTTTLEERLAAQEQQAAQAQLASHPASEDFTYEFSDDPLHPDSFQVTMWGGPYKGENVTHSDAGLVAGNYTFASWEDEVNPPIQGWIEVNPMRGSLTDIFQGWQKQLIEQKQMLAYDYEINGQVSQNDAGSFRAFKRQMRELDRMQRRINWAINRETKIESSMSRRYNNFMKDASVLLFPNGERSFNPTTDPVFDHNELERVRNGEEMTKLVMVADYEDIQWKLSMVEQLRRELSRSKGVASEELERLERRRKMLRITDHLRHNDRMFMANEFRMQQVMNHMDHLNSQIADLRGRRMTLALSSELIAPDGMFHPLDDEERDLLDERALLESEKQQLDNQFANMDPESPERMGLQRRRQWVARDIEEINSQMGILTQSRVALNALKDSSDTIHRQGSFRMLAASYVSNDIPFMVRHAVESQALMTVRIEACEDLFAPKAEMACVDRP